jgi:hypothetical protein
MKIVSATSMLLLIALTLACGYSKKAAAPPTAGNVPAISQLNPDATTSGGPAFVMTVNGSSFSGKAVVNWNGAALASSTAVISANQLTVTVPAAMIASPATVQVTVTNPGTPGTGLYGGGGTLAETSSPMSFTIN